MTLPKPPEGHGQPAEGRSEPTADATPIARPDSPAAAQHQAQARPAGAVGGHTVQDWEQSAPSPPMPRKASVQPALPGPEAVSQVLADPSPPTAALYLRPAVSTVDAPSAPSAAVAFDAKAQTLTAQSAALVDALTHGLSEALALRLRPVVAATVDQLIPMILSLGNTPTVDSEEPPAEGTPSAVRGQDKGEAAGDAPGA